MSNPRTKILSTEKKPIAIMESAKRFKRIFCFSVILLCLIKLSTYFLYNFVPLNQTSNRLEPFTKQNDAKSKNGVVGRIGRTIPMTPSPRKINPAKINKGLINAFIIPPAFQDENHVYDKKMTSSQKIIFNHFHHIEKQFFLSKGTPSFLVPLAIGPF